MHITTSAAGPRLPPPYVVRSCKTTNDDKYWCALNGPPGSCLANPRSCHAASYDAQFHGVYLAPQSGNYTLEIRNKNLLEPADIEFSFSAAPPPREWTRRAACRACLPNPWPWMPCRSGLRAQHARW